MADDGPGAEWIGSQLCKSYRKKVQLKFIAGGDNGKLFLSSAVRHIAAPPTHKRRRF